MTNIDKEKQSKNVHLHNESELFKIIDKYLPEKYAVEAVRLLGLRNIEVSKDIVRGVKSGKNSPFKNQILLVLVEMANAEKCAIEALNQTVTN